MQRRDINLTLNGKNYKFSERNLEDSSYAALLSKIRQHRFKFIQENVTDQEDRLAMLMAEMDKVYSNMDVGVYISGSIDEQYKIAYDSFKINNPAILFDEFVKLIPSGELKGIVELIYKLEREDSSEKKKKVKQ